MKTTLPVSIAIPTYRRERVLLETLGYLLKLSPAPSEILVLDQTDKHDATTEQQLAALNTAGEIRWIRLAVPSIPQAMNRGLLEARENLVLFLDDDIRPEPELVAAHHAAHAACSDVLIAGRVIQPWEEGRDFSSEEEFHFAGLKPAWIQQFMGGNFSVRRTMALALGGFDENFVQVAYRFEAEFAHRVCAAGNRIYFEPAACLHHLKAGGGGTRTFGDHLRTWRPDHAVGAYYCALRTRRGGQGLLEFVVRPLQSVITRHHLRRPWWIPLTLFAEMRGMVWALQLSRRGPQLVRTEEDHA